MCYIAILIEIPAINYLNVTDRCTSVIASWNIIGRACTNLSYNVTLSSSDGVTLGPFTTSDITYKFIDVDKINGKITVDVFAFTDNANESDVTETANIHVSQNG